MDSVRGGFAKRARTTPRRACPLDKNPGRGFHDTSRERVSGNGPLNVPSVAAVRTARPPCPAPPKQTRRPMRDAWEWEPDARDPTRASFARSAPAEPGAAATRLVVQVSANIVGAICARRSVRGVMRQCPDVNRCFFFCERLEMREEISSSPKERK